MILLILFLSVFIFYTAVLSCLNFKENYFLKSIISISVSISFISILYSINIFLNLSYDTFIIELVCLDLVTVFLTRKTHLDIFKINYKINLSSIYLSLIILVGTILFWYKSSRWGGWDAWAIWNLHAKFLFYEECWTNLLTNKISWTHPDYPIMLPSLIAVFWRGIGYIDPIVPALISYFVFIGILCFIWNSFHNASFKSIALLSSMILAIDIRFVLQASSQYADTIVALFILITVVLFSKRQDKPLVFFLLLGFFSSMPIWVKNEGNIFFIFTSILMVHQYKNEPPKIFAFLIGTLPVVLLYSCFKIFFAPDNDIIGALNTNTYGKVMNLDRYIIVVKHLIDTLIHHFPVLLVLFFIVLVFYTKALFTRMSFIIFSTLFSYLFVYIITPHDINWHLSSSLNRLIHHLYPSCIYCSFLIFDKYFSGPIFFKRISLHLDKKFRFLL